jgi:FAD/FMN-containing dehydrogenase
MVPAATATPARPPTPAHDEPAFLAAADALLAGHLRTDPQETAAFLTDWRGRYHGRAVAVALPGSTQEVAALVKLCAQHRVPIVPQGGNTGLVGGATPDSSGRALLLSLRRMNRVRSIDLHGDTLTAEAGCILADLQQTALAAGRLFPLSLAAEGSCTIGGNLSTNAGGTQVLRYGNARAQCLGLEVVTANGEIWDGLRALRKDNTGYDLRDLFIGAEGTLGIITAAVLALTPLPAAQVTALASVADLQAALDLLTLARTQLGSALTAFEVMSKTSIAVVAEQFADEKPPFDPMPPWTVLLESSDAESHQHAQERFEALLAQAIDQELVSDAVIAQSIAQSQAFWRIRERIPLAQAREGANLKHDIALPLACIPDFAAQCAAAVDQILPGARMVVFGHLGDGNLHYNVAAPLGMPPNDLLPYQAEVAALVHDQVQARCGSFSAEHGVGQLKRADLAQRKSVVELNLMRAIKNALDPDGILNPGKVL